MPVACVKTESPDQTFRGQPRLYLPVFGHVLLIVIGQEIVLKRWQVEQQGGQGKAKANPNLQSPILRWLIHVDIEGESTSQFNSEGRQ